MDDIPTITEHLQEPAIAEGTLRLPFPYQAKDARRWISRIEKTGQKNLHPAAFALREKGGRLVGVIGFDGLAPGRTLAGFGYWLAKSYWGRGLMTAAVGRFCALAFEEFSLRSLSAEVFAFNTASARVLEKNGFVREPGRPYPLVKNGRLQEAYRYWKHAKG
jgi:[ribosomal protein S5]-alanine N-acetyltransferase